MAMTEDELNCAKHKRREAMVRILAIFTSLSAAACMVFFVFKLFHGKITSEQKVREAVESERKNFEAQASARRPPREEIPTSFSATPAPRVTKVDAVDMSRPSPEPEAGVAPAPSRELPREAPVPQPATQSATPAVAASGDSKIIENLDQKKSAIAQTLREFFKAGSVAEMLPLVRDARRVRPLMDEYYQRQPMERRDWKGVGWTLPVEEPGFRFAYAQAIFADGSTVNVVVEETGAGFLVDWESTVQYSEIGWREFIATRPAQPKIFRLIASKAEAGPGQTMLALKHPQEDGVVLGRFDPRDPRFRSLVEQLDLCKWKDVPVILRLCYPGPATESGGEVQIAGVEGKGWLVLGERIRRS